MTYRPGNGRINNLNPVQYNHPIQEPTSAPTTSKLGLMFLSCTRWIRDVVQRLENWSAKITSMCEGTERCYMGQGEGFQGGRADGPISQTMTLSIIHWYYDRWEATSYSHWRLSRRYRDYFMVGECVRFLFTSCEESQTNEWAQRTSEFAILHNKWIKIVQANQPWSYLFIL